MRTLRMRDAFGVRASNVIENILWRDGPEGYPFMPDRTKIGDLSRRSLRLRLKAAANQHHSAGGSVWKLLAVQRNCGSVTIDEILTWIGLSVPPGRPHTCRCRTCGRALSSRAPVPSGHPEPNDHDEDRDWEDAANFIEDEPSGGPP